MWCPALLTRACCAVLCAAGKDASAKLDEGKSAIQQGQSAVSDKLEEGKRAIDQGQAKVANKANRIFGNGNQARGAVNRAKGKAGGWQGWVRRRLLCGGILPCALDAAELFSEQL